MKKLISLLVFFIVIFGCYFWVYKKDPIGLDIDIPFIYATISTLFLWLLLVFLSIFYKKIKIILNSLFLSFIFIISTISLDLFVENRLSKIVIGYCDSKTFPDLDKYATRLAAIDCVDRINGMKFIVIMMLVAIFLINLDKITRFKYLEKYYKKINF